MSNQLEITKAFAIEQAADPHWIFFDRDAIKSLETVKKSAEANGYTDLKWYQRGRVSKLTGGPYTERKICATYRVGGGADADRLMVSWVRPSGSVSWKAAFSDDGWIPAAIPPLDQQPKDLPPETEAERNHPEMSQ